MGQRTRTPASNSGFGNVVVNVTRTAGGSSDPSSSWVLVAVALAIGYAMGSTTTSNALSLGWIGRTAWKGIALFEEWVRDVVVPCYTLSAFLYLLSQNYHDGRDDKIQESKSLAAVRSALSSFYSQLPPALRKLSSASKAETEPTPSTSSVTEEDPEDDDEGDKPIDMTGVFKVVENDNFGEFLKAQGVPWFLCNAASKARPTHHFTHSSAKKLTIQIRGIIESETSYQIGGPHTETTIRGRIFKDSLSYLYDGTATAGSSSDEGDNDETKICVGVQTRKIAVGEGYEVHVERRIIRAGTTWTPTPEENPDGHCTYDLDTPCGFDRLLMTNKVVYEEGRDEESIIASQMFHRTD